MSGSNTVGAVSVYGTQGVPDAANVPSARIYSLTLIGYFIMALALSVSMRWLEHKLRRGTAFPRGAQA